MHAPFFHLGFTFHVHCLLPSRQPLCNSPPKIILGSSGDTWWIETELMDSVDAKWCGSPHCFGVRKSIISFPNLRHSCWRNCTSQCETQTTWMDKHVANVMLFRMVPPDLFSKGTCKSSWAGTKGRTTGNATSTQRGFACRRRKSTYIERRWSSSGAAVTDDPHSAPRQASRIKCMSYL
jgi:hypothetical protein